jgi:hypothetical protein
LEDERIPRKKGIRRIGKINDLFIGSLPIYMGAPNIDDWLPGKDSVVKTSDFASPKALADYLKKLLEDEKEYKEYFTWKKDKISRKVLISQNLAFL